MRESPRANGNWKTPPEGAFTWEHVTIEVLMDLRDQLKEIRELLWGVRAALKELPRRRKRAKSRRDP